jgi:hypothetical protein
VVAAGINCGSTLELSKRRPGSGLQWRFLEVPLRVTPHKSSCAPFSRLGARIADPQAFRAPAADDTPAPVQALAAQLWDTAQALARGQAETRALDAEARADAALAERDAARSAHALALAEQRAQALAAELDALRIAHAAEHASLSERLLALQRHAADMDRERQARLLGF